VELFLSQLIDKLLDKLNQSCCVDVVDGFELELTVIGKITSYYYLQHKMMCYFLDKLSHNMKFEEVLASLTDAEEYKELPI